MVKVGDIITIKSARFGEQKAKVIGGEAKRAKRWKLEIVDSGKVRFVDKEKLSEQSSEPVKKIPKPVSMLQTIDLSSMPTVNQQLDDLTEILQSVSIKDEEEKNKVVKEVTQSPPVLEGWSMKPKESEIKKLDAMNDKQRIKFLLNKFPEKFKEITDDFEMYLRFVDSDVKEINDIVNKYGVSSEKVADFNLSSLKQYDLFDVKKLEVYEIGYHDFPYRLVKGEAVKRLEAKHSELLEKRDKLLKKYAPSHPELRKKYGIYDPADEEEDTDKYFDEVTGEDYMKVWDPEEGGWVIVDPESGEMLGVLDSSGELQRF
jgi:hypothetical protein